MIQLNRITDSTDIVFQKLVKLYIEAFPESERREIQQLEELLKTEPLMHFNAVECDGDLSGLFVYWDLDGFYYMEYLAVFAEMRNKKIGQQVLDWIKVHLKGGCIFEVEPAETEMALRRIHFYKRNGYLVLDKNYRQPSYKGDHEEFPLWIMGNDGEKLSEVLEGQIVVLKDKVYYRK